MARYWQGQYRGWIWKGSEVIVVYEGVGIDRIIESLKAIIDNIYL